LDGWLRGMVVGMGGWNFVVFLIRRINGSVNGRECVDEERDCRCKGVAGERCVMGRGWLG
jgi:hypothetical protein